MHDSVDAFFLPSFFSLSISLFLFLSLSRTDGKQADNKKLCAIRMKVVDAHWKV